VNQLQGQQGRAAGEPMRALTEEARSRSAAAGRVARAAAALAAADLARPGPAPARPCWPWRLNSPEIAAAR